jgi:hypothetical protein
MCVFDVYRSAPTAGRRAAPGPAPAQVRPDEAPRSGIGDETSAPTHRERLWLAAIASFMRAAAEDLGPDSPVGRRLADGASEAWTQMTPPRPSLALVPDPAGEAPAGGRAP